MGLFWALSASFFLWVCHGVVAFASKVPADLAHIDYSQMANWAGVNNLPVPLCPFNFLCLGRSEGSRAGRSVK